MNQIDSRRRLLALNLAAMAGYIDATGFLSGTGYFVSFMSGNTTRLAVDLARDPALALVPAMLLAGFLAGVVAGALLAFAAGARRKPAVLAVVTVLLAGAAIAGHSGAARLALLLMVLAMGALNNVFQRDGTVTIGLTYMTGALVRGGQGLAARIAGRSGEGWGAHLLLWAGLASGGIAGAFAWRSLGTNTEIVACLWSAALTAVALRFPVETA